MLACGNCHTFNEMYGWLRWRVYWRCPRWDSGTSSRAGRLFLKECRQFSVRVAAMRYAIFLLRRHLGVRLRCATRLEPRIPAEAAAAPRLDQDLAQTLTEEHV